MERSAHRRRGGVAALVALLPAVVLATPAGATAPEVVSAYSVACDVSPEDATAYTEDPQGLYYDGSLTGLSLEPDNRRMRATAVAEGVPIESCHVSLDLVNTFRPMPGTSGLHVGLRVPVSITVALDADVQETWDAGDPSFTSTSASYTAQMSILEVGCSGPGCDRPLAFNSTHTHDLRALLHTPEYPDGSLEVIGSHTTTMRTNAPVWPTSVVSESADESRPGPVSPDPLCSSWPCDPAVRPVHAAPQAARTFTAPALLTLGRAYSLESVVQVAAGIDGHPGTAAVADVEDFRITITPDDAGVLLDYAASDDAPPTTGFGMHPEPSPAGWSTAPTEVTLVAGDPGDAGHLAPAGSGVETMTYRTTGAVTTPETTVHGDTVFIDVDVDGITEIIFSATDVAGNTSLPRTVTVKLDRAGPVISGADDVSVEAADGVSTVVDWAVSATDVHSGPVTPTCTPTSGSSFAVGAHTVTCTATDEAGNTSTESFTVTVTAPAAAAMDELGSALRSAPVPPWSGVLLTAVHDLAERAFDAGNRAVGCVLLSTLDGLVRLQSGRFIPVPVAAELRGLTRDAGVEEGC